MPLTGNLHDRFRGATMPPRRCLKQSTSGSVRPRSVCLEVRKRTRPTDWRFELMLILILLQTTKGPRLLKNDFGCPGLFASPTLQPRC